MLWFNAQCSFSKFILVYIFMKSSVNGMILSKLTESQCILTPPNDVKASEQNQFIQDELLSFIKDKGLYGAKFTYEIKSAHLAYDLSICSDIMKPNTSLLRRVTAEGSKSSTSIGLRNSTHIAGKKGEWVMISFGPGEVDSTSPCLKTHLSSSLMITCDRKFSKGQFKLLYEDRTYCHFQFELRTSAICGPMPGMSGWSILFILILVGFVLYFLIGFLYLRIQTGAKGIDQIPNRTFWFAVGNKLADGCSAVCRCDQFCVEPIDRLDSRSSFTDGYSPIGGNSPATISPQRDRDTTLLNP